MTSASTNSTTPKSRGRSVPATVDLFAPFGPATTTTTGLLAPRLSDMGT
jgi:hypothetical protein